MRPSLFAVLLLAATAAVAHHSAPAFYKVDDRITVVGTVIDFRLSNPHPIDCDPTYGIAIDSRQGPGEE